MSHSQFDQIHSRANTSCVKYDLRGEVFGNPGVIPMWVADMDIATPRFILDAIKERCQHPILGYSFRGKAYNEAIVWWSRARHGWAIEPEWITFCAGVVSGLNHAIQAFTSPGDRVIIQPPVYHPFFHTVRNNKRELLLNPLIETNGHYTMDFDGLERMAASGAKMIIVSNPHNPVGRVWTGEELARLGEICLKHNVLVISDEIHSDLIFRPHRHIPFASLDDQFAASSVTFASVSKTFNVAGLASGYAIIGNGELRRRYNDALELTGSGMGNVFGCVALEAAYSRAGVEWLHELLEYLRGNVELVKHFMETHLPAVKLTEPQGTYLLWLDFRSLGMEEEALNELLTRKAQVGLNPGGTFGAQGQGFQRMNIACPRAILNEALGRIGETLANLKPETGY